MNFQQQKNSKSHKVFYFYILQKQRATRTIKSIKKATKEEEGVGRAVNDSCMIHMSTMASIKVLTSIIDKHWGKTKQMCNSFNE